LYPAAALQVENALNTLDKIQRMSAAPAPGLVRASQNLALARVSAVNLRRASLTGVPPADLENSVQDIHNVVDEMKAAAEEVPEEVRMPQPRAVGWCSTAAGWCCPAGVEFSGFLLHCHAGLTATAAAAPCSCQSCPALTAATVPPLVQKRAELMKDIEGVQRAVANLQRVSAVVLHKTSAGPSTK
jgi:hypothetical protein